MINDLFEISSCCNLHFENSEDEISMVLIDQNSNKFEEKFPFFGIKSENEFDSEEFRNYPLPSEPLNIFAQEKKEEKKPKTKNKYTSTKTKTKSKTTKVMPEPLIKKKGKIFSINKVNKKLGRVSHSSKVRKYVKHDKFFQDNIIQKIKVYFNDHIISYINQIYEYYLESKNEKLGKLIEKISPKVYISIKIEDNLKWFSFKLKDVLSGDISNKYRKLNKDYNKRRIDALYRENKAKSVIEILEKTIGEMYEIYSKNIFLKGFKTLNYDLQDLRNKMESNEEEEKEIQKYLEKYEKIAINLKDIISRKKSKQKARK